MDEKILEEALNNKEDKSTKQDWLYPLLLATGMSLGSGKPEPDKDRNLMLEKEVSYLHGKIDTLEKLLRG